MIYVTGKRLSNGGSRPSHITHLQWEEVGTNTADISPRAQMVEWVDSGIVAKVRNAFGVDVDVRTVHPQGAASYVQTKPDNTTTDNLLSLPDC